MFDLSSHMERLMRDVVHHTPELAHVDCDRVLLTVSQQRKFGRPGLYAQLVPMRFQGGALTMRQHGADWAVPPVLRHEREILYLITFCLPRFLNLSFESKALTLFHELYHISPHFDGDFRRFPGKYYLHGADVKKYDAHMLALYRAYAARSGAPHLMQFLRSRFHHLEDRYGCVTGMAVSAPPPQQVAAPAVALPARELTVRYVALTSQRERLRRSA